MSKAQEKALEGFICPSCVVDFPSALKLQDHWLNFHAEEENSCTASQDLRDKEPKDYEEILELPDGATAKVPHQFYMMPAEAHQFTSYNFKLADACVVCANLINSEGRLCKGCNYACHNKCENLVKSRCPKPIVGNLPQDKRAVQDANTTKSQTPPAKSLVTHLRHRVSKGRNRHVDEGIDLDLTYITERIIAMSFPASGLESTYRNSLRDVAKMLKRKHEDKYMVFNLSERRYDISQLNNQVLDFGWPDHLAPPLERLISIIKSIDSWLKSDMQHVVVVHCKGGKGRTGVVIAAYMHFSKMCTSPQAALDWFAMKRFCDDGLKGVTQPSQRRYVHYFSDFLEGKVALNSKPKFLHHVIIHGIPNFDGKGGCKPYLRVYNGLKLIYTSGIFHVTSDMERICITIENGLEICGDILVKCYNKNALPSGRDIIFRCQFNTGAIVDNGLVLEKSELDDSRKDKRFPDSAKVEFVFSLSGDFVADYKDNKRLQSILRHSLQPMENADVLFSFHLSEEWDQGEHIDEADQEFENCRRERGKENIISVDLAKRQESDKNFAEPDTTICSYIPGPVNGNLYAQVDKSWKERVRSHSLDSSSSFPYVQHNKYERGKAVTLGRPNQNKEQKNSYPLKKNRVQGFDYSALGMSVSSPTVQTESRKRIPDMDGLLSQLNACTDFLDTAVNQHRSALQRRNQNSDNNDLYFNGPLQPQVSVDDRIKGYSSKRTAVPVAPTRRAASFDATSRYQGSGHSLPAAMRTQTPPLEQRATLGRVAEKQDSYLPSPLLTSTPATLNNKANFGGQIFTASEIQTSPPDSPVKPKYFATQIVPTVQRAPAEVVNVTTQHSDSLNGFRSPHEESGVRTQAVCNGVQRVNQPVTIRLETVEKENIQKYSLATLPSDLNNNDKVTHRDSEKLPEVSSNGVNGFIQETRDNNVEREKQLPEKGIVAANVALLSDMFSPTKVQYIRRPPLKGTVPMPGLTTKTAEEVSREISDYNAKALAPGEISHSSGTLYFTGLPPKRVLEKGEHEPIEVKLEILPRGITVETTRPEPRENEHGMFYHSPTGSFDQVSVDEGVESKADTDEIGLTLGPSPTDSTSSHADSAFGDWASFSRLSSALSSPVTRYSPYRLTQTSQEPELEVEPQLDEASSRSSISSLLEGAAEEKAEEPGKEKEEVEDDPGYARLEDIKTAKHAARNARLASVESKRDDVTSPSAISPTTQKTSISDHEAVHEIVTEIVSTNEQAMDIQESAPSGPGTPYTNRSGTTTPTSIHSHRSPIHSGSDSPFGRERNKSGQQSDKGYGSTASVSSNNSSSSDVFFDGPRVPGIKFDKDTSALWYKPNISRDQTIELLKDKEPGSFIIRDSTSFKGFFGLALKVAVPPASVLQGDLSNVDMTNELVRHFLIESTKKGVRLRGNENDEPIFGSLSAFVYQHSLTPLALPLRLVLPTDDSLDDLFDYPDKPLTPTQKFSQGAVYNLMFMGLCAVELLTGPSAIERTVELLRSARELPVLAPVTFKVNPKGITLTDNNRKAFFRKHFDMKAIQYCGIDPLDKRWDLKVSTFSGQSRCFGLVVRKNGEMHNECHLFAEMEDDTPISVVVNSVNRYMSVPT